MLQLLKLVAAAALCASQPLPTDLSIDPNGISISGLSSGADFVVQLQVAHSALIKGVGIFAGQPYHCAVTRFVADELVPQCSNSPKKPCTARTPSPSVPICDGCPEGQTLTYDHCKTKPDWVNVSVLLDYARHQADAGEIDGLGNLSSTPVYVYRGTKDACYLQGSLAKVQAFFVALNSNVQFNKTTPSAHSWPTADWGTPCGHGAIENCGYDGPGAALQHIYGGSDSQGHGGTLHSPIASVNSSLSEFDQHPFFSQDNNGTNTYNETTPHSTGFAPFGFVYVPEACKSGSKQCKLHFSLHGCGVVGGPTGDGYYDDEVHHLGFQRWGEANGIVIVYPKLQSHGGTVQTQTGCWDGYAQSGSDYALQSGAQISAIRSMIKVLARV